MDKDSMLELAWEIIANAGYGNWETQSSDWQQAARNWREEYFKIDDKTFLKNNPLTDLIEVLETHNIHHKIDIDFSRKEKCLILEDHESEGNAVFTFDYDGNLIELTISN